MTSSRAARRRHLPTSPFKPPSVGPEPETYALDDQVTHEKYGLGRVIGVEEGVAVTIDFGLPILRIVAPYHKLVKL
ncbi:hypothetical protein SAMN04489712_112101 [Thermomonospora echinospora]|uniref:Uncharacterized protein n=1 Tax=Thermomonospora echinospora TaxID=1992 RepID=A0A1H6D0F2_9ACTN|nr:hypothetical protein [Thermomonospora echinospora]SEG78617.1 hypothetical protein SAMN04489712_112101 [Thermomonospora echinospora]